MLGPTTNTHVNTVYSVLLYCYYTVIKQSTPVRFLTPQRRAQNTTNEFCKNDKGDMGRLLQMITARFIFLFV